MDQKDTLSTNQRNQINRLGLTEKSFQGENALDLSIVTDLLKSKVLREKSYKEDPTDPYYLLVQALKDKKLPNGASQAKRFLKALEGGGLEKAEAKDILKEINGATGWISPQKQEKLIKRLDEKRNEDQIAGQKSSIENLLSKVETETESEGVKKGVEKFLADVEKGESMAKFGGWEIEAPDQKLLDDLKEHGDKLKALSRDFAATCQNLEAGADQYEKLYAQAEKMQPGPQKSTIESKLKELKSKLEKLEKKRKQIEKEMVKAQVELEPYYNELIDYLREKLKQKRAFSLVEDETGIDLIDNPKINYWDFELASPDSAQIGGVEASPSGKARKKTGKMEVGKLYFEKGDFVGEEPDSAGRMVIEMREQGKSEWKKMGLKSFTQLMQALEGHQQIDSLEVLNQKLEDQTYKKPLKSGDKFTRKFIVDGPGNTSVPEQESFEIADIDEQNGTITLNRSVTKIPKEKLSDSVHSSLYFDRRQQKYSFGEFAQLVKANSYKRDLALDEDVSKIAERYNLDLPQEGEEKNVNIFGDDGKVKKGVIKNNNGQYDLEYVNETDVETGYKAAVLPSTKEILNNEKDSARWKIKRKPLSDFSNMEMVTKGNIENDLTDEPGLNEDFEDIPNELQPQQNESAPPASNVTESDFKTPSGPQAEALPYDMIHKVGNMETRERSWLRGLLADTRTMNATDFIAMWKSLHEYWSRRWDRKRKETFSNVGKDLPFFGPEMQRINQSAENEEVNQFKDSFEQKGIWEIQDRMRVTGNQDELKACFVDLCSKGQIRWDDIEMWKNLNKFVDAKYAIPIPRNGDPATWVSDDPKHPDYQKTGFSYLQGAIDSLWGEGTYNDWYSQSKGASESGAKKYYEEGKQLESLQGGHERRLAELLKSHKRGEFVDPHEYEGLIMHMIDAGKGSMQGKLYYMIEGVAAKNPQGRTILSFDRMAHFNADMLHKLPPLEYLCARARREDRRTGEVTSHRFTIDDYEEWIKDWDRDDPMNASPNYYVDEFMWEYVLPSDDNQNRVNKDIRNADVMDHDDMSYIIPMASTQLVDNVTRSVGGGGKHLVTIEGYANAAPGYSQFIKKLGEQGNTHKLIRALQSYVRYEAIMRKRWHREKTDYARMDAETLNASTIVSDEAPIDFFNQINGLLKKVAEAYGDPDLMRAVDLIQTDTSTWDMGNKEQKRGQQQIQHQLEIFDQVFEKAVKIDGGQTLLALVNSTDLIGMGYDPTKILERKAAKGGN